MPDPIVPAPDTLLGSPPAAAPAAVPAPAAPVGDPNAPPAVETPPAAPAATETPAPAAAPNVSAPPAAEPGAAPDWATQRTAAANGDDKVLARLARYGTLDEALRAGVEAQQKLGERLPEKAPGPEATDDEKAAYRAANGIPATPADYEISLPEGLVLGDADQPVADAFLAIAHEHNISPAVANNIIAGQLKLQDQMIQAQETADTDQRIETETILSGQDMWGGETAANLNMINTLLDNSPPGTKEQFMNARLGDGSLLGNNVDALKWMNALARQINPSTTIVPSQGRTALVSAQQEKAGLEAMMGDRSSEYHRGPKANANQERYRELVDYITKTTPQT